MTILKNFDVPARWSNPDGTLTERARGFLRALFEYIGANTGVFPVDSIGGDGVSTTTFFREDGTFAVPAYPVGANPSGTIGLTAVNGSAATFLRSDGSPALSLGIEPTWTGAHTFSSGLTTTTMAASGAVSGSTATFSGALTCTTCTPSGAFGCNGKTAQTAATAAAAISATAGALYTGTEQGMINDLKTLTNQIRAALVADGIMV